MLYVREEVSSILLQKFSLQRKLLHQTSTYTYMYIRMYICICHVATYFYIEICFLDLEAKINPFPLSYQFLHHVTI